MTAGKAKWGCLGLVVWVVWSVGGAEAERPHEINYAARFCIAEGGVLEEKLPKDGRPDCITDTHVIEADFWDEARESVNQVEQYMAHDPEKRKGGILLILENDNKRYIHNKRYIQKLCDVMAEKKVTADIWIMYSDFTYQSYSCNGREPGPLKKLDCGMPLPR